MDILTTVMCSGRPDEVAEGPTGVRYSYNIVEHEATDTMGVHWTCSQFWFPAGEYQMVQNGKLPYTGIKWSDAPELHKIFRNAVHRRTDDLYNLAYRKKRTAANPEAWAAYIDELDEWNTAVSALKTGYSTDVPALPVMP